MNEISTSLSILVLSCDKYAGLWDLFFSRFKKYWPDCPFPLYLLGNKKAFKDDHVASILTGEDKDWSSNLLFALSKIETENVLLMMEDALLDNEVDTSEFLNIYRNYCVREMNHLNLKADPLPTSSKEGVGELPVGANYRVSAVPNLWRVQVLKEIILPGESAWGFEILGSVRSDKISGFYSLQRPYFQLLHCVVQGKFDRRAYKKLQKTGEWAAVDFPVMSKMEYYKLLLREIRSFLFKMSTPYAYRRTIRKLYYEYIVRNNRLV